MIEKAGLGCSAGRLAPYRIVKWDFNGLVSEHYRYEEEEVENEMSIARDGWRSAVVFEHFPSGWLAVDWFGPDSRPEIERLRRAVRPGPEYRGPVRSESKKSVHGA